MPKLGAADAGKDGTTTVGSNQARAKFVEAHLQSSPACEVRRAPAQKKKPRQIRRKAAEQSHGIGRYTACYSSISAVNPAFRYPNKWNVSHLHCDRPTAPGGILPHAPVLHRQRLLIIGGDPGIQPRAQHFRLFP